MAIVGAGVAGLSAAAMLAREGWRVRVLEANSKVGGCGATTNVEGYTFNDGALYLALPELLDHLFLGLGLDRRAELPLRRISPAQVTSLPDGTVVTIDGAFDVRVEGGARTDPGRLRAELAAFANRWDPLLRVFTDDLWQHPFSTSRLVARAWRHLPRARGSAAAHLRASFNSRAVRAALSGALLHLGVAPERTPALYLIGVVATLRDGLFLPEGGMGRLPEALSRAVRRNGGEIHLDSPVVRIRLRNGRVWGVETTSAGVIRADAVISTVSGMHTFETLMAPHDAPARVRRKVRRATLSHKGFVLQLGLRRKAEVSGHYLQVLPWMEDQQAVFRPAERDRVAWPIYTVPTVTMPELASPGCDIVEMFPPIDQVLRAEDWSEARKEAVAAAAMGTLSRLHGFEEGDVAVRRIRSPKEFQESLHLYGGALYGLSPTASPRALFPHRSRISGLYQAGQTTWPGFGVGGAALSGVLAAEALLSAGAA